MAEIIAPYMRALYPLDGSADLNRASPLEYILTDIGGSKLNPASLSVKVNVAGGGDVDVFIAGVLQGGSGWEDDTYVAYSEVGDASVGNLKLIKNALLAYGDTLAVTLAVQDNLANATQRPFAYQVVADPRYDGSAPTPLETCMSTAYQDPRIEFLRNSLINASVSDAAGANRNQRASRRLLQVLARTGGQPLVRWLWLEDPDVNSGPVLNGKSLYSFKTLEADLISAARDVIHVIKYKVDSSAIEYLESHKESLGGFSNITTAILTQVLVCKLRANGLLV